MQKIYSHISTTHVHHVKNVLQNHGIETEVKGEKLADASGGVAPIDAWVELWLIDDSQFQEAKQIVDDVLEDFNTESADRQELEPWTCPNCGKEVEGEFAVCWNCESERPEGTIKRVTVLG